MGEAGRALWALHQGFANRDTGLLARACAWSARGVAWFDSPPFSEDLPELPADRPVIFYGSTRVTSLVAAAGRWSPGVFFDAERFSMRTQMARWPAGMVNASAAIVPLSDVAHRLAGSGDIFVRPVEDLKEFPGHVAATGDVAAWARAAVASGGLAATTEVLVAPVVHLDIEWRLFIVDRRVVGGCRYREDGASVSRRDLPHEVAAFGAAAAEEYSPAPVFVLDVALVGGRLQIVEANGFNSCGLYEADAGAIVETVSAFVESS